MNRKIFALQVWEEEGGALEAVASNGPEKRIQGLDSEINHVDDALPGENNIGLPQELLHLGYSQEDLYFYKLNRDLIERSKLRKSA